MPEAHRLLRAARTHAYRTFYAGSRPQFALANVRPAVPARYRAPATTSCSRSSGGVRVSDLPHKKPERLDKLCLLPKEHFKFILHLPPNFTLKPVKGLLQGPAAEPPRVIQA